MDSQNKLIENIQSTTKEIHQKYPKLVDDMTEISKTFLSDTKNGTNNKELKSYLDSLKAPLD